MKCSPELSIAVPAVFKCSPLQLPTLYKVSEFRGMGLFSHK